MVMLRSSTEQKPGRRVVSSRTQREWIDALVFLAPQLIGLVVFAGGPLLMSLWYSFSHWNLVAPSPTWVGLDNWKYLFRDPRIQKVLFNTIKFICIHVPSFLLGSFALTLLLNRIQRGVSVLRALFFLPWIMSSIAVGVTWRWMFNSRSGPVTQVIRVFTGYSPNLLLDERYAMAAIAIVATWQLLGYGMTFFTAGLTSIPMELYESAKIDGATYMQQTRYITLPLLSPTTLFLAVTSLIGAFQCFDLVVAMTGDLTNVAPGGPGGSTRTIVLYLYNQMFEYSETYSGLGYAAVIAWVLALLIFAVTFIQWKLSKRWVYSD